MQGFNGNLNKFTQIITSLLISRMQLNLRTSYEGQAEIQLTTIQFNAGPRPVNDTISIATENGIASENDIVRSRPSTSLDIAGTATHTTCI